MKAAVIIPPLEDFYFTAHRFSCLGAQRAAEIIESSGRIDTELIIFPLMEKQQIPLPGYQKYLKKFIMEGETGSCSFFSVFRRYGPDTEKCCTVLEKIKPDYVFFSLFAYCYAEPAVELADMLKKRMPETFLAAGGAGVSVYPEYFHPHFDAVLPGEGEIVLKEFITQLVRNKAPENGSSGNNRIIEEVSGGACSDEGCSGKGKKAVCSGDGGYVADISQSNRDFGAVKPHRDGGFCSYQYRHTMEGDFSLSVTTVRADSRSVNVSALLTRGCNKKCRFCSNFITHGREFRKTSYEDIKNELERKKALFTLHRDKKFFINFEDDNLLTDRDYFFNSIDIFTSFFRQFTEEGKILLSAENGLDYTLLTEDLCGKLIDRNFRQFNFTLGSVSSDVLGGEKRSGSSRHLSQLLKYISSRSVPAVSYFIAGLGNDTPEKVIDSLLFIAENPGISGISMFYSVPGLPDFSDTAYFRKIPPGLLRGSAAYPWNNSLSTEEMITAFRISRTVNLFKKENPGETDTELIRKIRQEKKLLTLVRKNKKLEIKRPASIDRKMEELFFRSFFEL